MNTTPTPQAWGELHVLTEQRLVSGLDERERARLRVLLRKLMRAVDSE